MIARIHYTLTHKLIDGYQSYALVSKAGKKNNESLSLT